ncbi:MAG TPA: kelch repeat-containing protein [Casimicrobiaceae bacterium]|nr:kelch repeat-containing protein [Casimicrobiaceae bacterium]
MTSRSMISVQASCLWAWLALAGALLGVAAPARCADGTWVATGSLRFARAGHAATLLPNGKVLVVGGAAAVAGAATDTSAEIYDPATGQWKLTGALGVGRSDPKATLLNNGQVLVVGGDRGEITPQSLGLLGTCEIYDPATGTWSNTGSLNTPRDGFTATLLANGEVLVAGGVDNADEPLKTAEIYDPNKGTWRYTGSFGGARLLHAATRLADGKVLIVGGASDDDFLAAIGGATVYDPATGTWNGAGGLYTPRAQATASLLANGDVLVAGGFDDLFYNPFAVTSVSYALTDLFDMTGHWSATAPMNARRYAHTATLLSNGEVLVTGGFDLNTSTELASAELYDVSTGTWHAAASMRDARQSHTATLLADGRVLVVGGYAGNQPLASAEILEPADVPVGTITAAFTGAWYDPAQSGHGLFVEVLSGNRFQAAWFAFDPSGKQQAWFTGVGTYNGNTATITNVVLPTGGRFIPNFDAAGVMRNPWGSLTFTFTDCNHGRVEFSSVDGYGSGGMNITRLTQPAGLACP